MSWSVSAIGKAEAVKAEISGQFAKSGKCLEPEEGIRLEAAKLIDAALAATDKSFVVKVSANGSQGFKDWVNKAGCSNNLTISVEPQHGFID